MQLVVHCAGKRLGGGIIEARRKARDAHLAHVFPDGPPSSNLRFYIGARARESEKKTPRQIDAHSIPIHPTRPKP